MHRAVAWHQCGIQTFTPRFWDSNHHSLSIQLIRALNTERENAAGFSFIEDSARRLTCISRPVSAFRDQQL